MVDYDRALPNGTMRIRDLGSVVEFWLYSNSSNVYHSALPWGYKINGQDRNTTVKWNRGVTQMRLGQWTVQTSQAVTFRLGNTGTATFGGPHTFTRQIDRHTARVRHAGSWKFAIPYVRHSGSWKIAQTYVRHGGSWRLGG